MVNKPLIRPYFSGGYVRGGWLISHNPGIYQPLKLPVSHLKMDGWKMSFLLGWPIFRCYVSFTESIFFRSIQNATKEETTCVYIILCVIMYKCKYVDIYIHTTCIETHIISYSAKGP